MLEARPFAVRTAALAHGLCGYVQVAAAEGPACIVAAESGGWLPFVVRQKLAGGWKALWLRDKGKWKALSTLRTEQLLAARAPGSIPEATDAKALGTIQESTAHTSPEQVAMLRRLGLNRVEVCGLSDRCGAVAWSATTA